jgi:hypothetical protein
MRLRYINTIWHGWKVRTCLGEKNGEAGVRRVGVQAVQQAASGRLEGCSARRRRHNHRTVLRRMRGLTDNKSAHAQTNKNLNVCKKQCCGSTTTGQS